MDRRVCVFSTTGMKQAVYALVFRLYGLPCARSHVKRSVTIRNMSEARNELTCSALEPVSMFSRDMVRCKKTTSPIPRIIAAADLWRESSPTCLHRRQQLSRHADLVVTDDVVIAAVIVFGDHGTPVSQ